MNIGDNALPTKLPLKIEVVNQAEDKFVEKLDSNDSSSKLYGQSE